MKHPRASRASVRGFTLIEVLVALAIVAIGMAAVLSTLTSSASTVIFMRDKMLASWVALNHIAEQRLQPQVPPLGKSDGNVDYAGQKWQWHQEVIETSVKGMVRMDVRVRPADSTADDERGWYVTMSGISGDALSPPRGDMPVWDAQGNSNNTPCPAPNGQPTAGSGSTNGGLSTPTTGSGSANGGLSTPTTNPCSTTNGQSTPTTGTNSTTNGQSTSTTGTNSTATSN